MGKNYIENSLKHFLKRKMKITLGFIVAFLITGTVGFAEESDYKSEMWLEGIGTEKNLSDKEILSDSTYTVKIEGNEIKITANGNENVIKLENLSNKTFESIETALENMYIAVNGTLENRLALSDGATEEYNKYLNASDNVGQGNTAEGTGKIKVLDKNILSAEKISLGDDGKITQYTDGDISSFLSKSSTMALAKNGGVLINKENIESATVELGYQPLQTAVDNSQIYNYGKIKLNKTVAQLGIRDSSVYNYGKIEVGDAQIVAEGSKAYNFGIINGGELGGQQIINKSIGYNYGKILGIQYVSNSEAYNFGIIIGNQQMLFYRGEDNNNINAKDTSKMVNYGYISGHQDIGLEKTFTSPTGRVDIFKGGEIINYGILSSQTAYNNNVTADNYGIISNFHALGKVTQHVGGYNITANNYGLIENYNENRYGQDINNGNFDTYNNTINNYGVIVSKGFGQQIKKDTGKKLINNKSYNYGIIVGGVGITVDNLDTTKEEDKNAGYNYGVIVNKGGAVVMKNNLPQEVHFATQGNVINNGIIFATDKGTGEMTEGGINNGVIYKETSNTFEVDIANTEIIDTNKNLSEINKNNKNNIFVDNSKENSNAVLTLDKDGLVDNTLAGKHITTIVGENSKIENVIEATDDLTLNGSSIVGYFEKNGTLLNVNGNLTLTNGSVISAVAGNEYTGYTGNKLDNVVAVTLKEDAELSIDGTSNILGAVKGNGVLVLKDFKGTRDYNDEIKELDIKTTAEKTGDKEQTNATINSVTVADGVVISGHETSKDNTKITFGNNIDINGGLKFEEISSEKLGADITLGDGKTDSDGTINIDSISLGSGEDILTIKNVLGEVGEIDGRDGDDIVKLENLNRNHDTFDYQLKNIETLDLSGETWKIGENASISFGDKTSEDNTKTTDNTEKTIVKNGTLLSEMKFDIDENGNTAEFSNANIDDVLAKTEFSTEKGKEGYLQLGIDAGSELQAGAEYSIDEDTKNSLADIPTSNIKVSGIFKGVGENIKVKTAQEMGIVGRYSELYNKMLANADREDVRNVLNNGSFEEIAEIINSKGAMGDTLATTGYKITRDISNSFISSVNEWNKKANKGEWLANAKYINSDMEYDGANKVKGYDSDITSMVGMVEYGVSDNTSYGVALGGGDTEVDVTGAGTLKGDNYYIGAYAKHSTNGFDLVGNLGYTISDLEVDGEGSADSSAITFAGYVKRDIKLTETIKLEPNLAFTYDYIMQDDAEGNGVKVENKDIHVFEATAGMNIVKEFAFNNGNLELKAGVKYSMADINRNEETTISAFGMEPEVLGNPEVDDTKGTAHIGFDFEHTTGFGVNGKYETMWSDSGDDSRITAGVSYRF